jgi:hypothetical protein
VISPWTLLGSLVVALGLAGCFYLGLLFTRPGRAPVALGTAVINVIPAPTSTISAPTIAPSPTISPTVSVPLPPEPGNLAVGSLVQITGTGGDPLRFRTDPGLSGQVVFLAIEAEVFEVTDGPREADGYTWWYLVGPYNPEQKGWAVANYLQVIQNP